MKDVSIVRDQKMEYTKIHVEIIQSDISNDAKFLYAKLMQLPEEFNPTFKFICKMMKISRNSTIKALGELESRNVIEIDRTTKTHVYSFKVKDQWTLKLG